MQLFFHEGNLVSTDILSFSKSMPVKNVKTVFKSISDFFLKHNFEGLIKTFHYHQSVENHGTPQGEVSVFEIPFLIPLQLSYESQGGLFQRHCFVGSNY